MMDTDFENKCNIQAIIRNASIRASEVINKRYGDKTAIEIWVQFLILHPNTPENPDYSEASVKRWLYHIKEAEKNKGFEKVELDMGPIEAIRKRKCVERWEEFDSFQKLSYRAISESYRGVQIFACGSQVRGDYMEYPLQENVMIARQKAGMRTDRFSDFDFWVENGFEPTSPLPNYADRYRGKFNEKEMVAIPVYYGDV